jgi:hypothetical protein
MIVDFRPHVALAQVVIRIDSHMMKLAMNGSKSKGHFVQCYASHDIRQLSTSYLILLSFCQSSN